MKNVLSFASKYRMTDFFLVLSGVAVATLVLVWLRSRLTIEVIALLYLVPVMLSATRWGLLPALVASLAAFLAFNYFFLVPTHTLTVSDPRELLALVIFLIVAILISQAVGAAHLHAAEAGTREMEATTLYNLTKALSAQTGLAETLSSVTRLVAEAFDLAGGEILLSTTDAHFCAARLGDRSHGAFRGHGDDGRCNQSGAGDPRTLAASSV